MVSLSWNQFNAWRLAQHYLLERAERGNLLEVVTGIVLVDGRIAGTWTHDRQRSRTVVEVDLFVPPGDRIKNGVEMEAKRLGDFLNSDIEVVYK